MNAPIDITRRNYMKIEEFCTLLDIARSTFNDWRVKGTAPRCIKLPNGGIRIRRRDFEAWEAQLEEPEAA